MMHELLAGLVRQALVLSAVILLVLVAARLVRRLAGADLAYACWIAVPLALAPAFLPAVAAPQSIAVALVLVDAPVGALGGYARAPRAPHGLEWNAAVLACWLAGSAAFLAWTWREHRRYRRALGRLHARGAHLVCSNPAQGPAVVGLWRPAIVLPPDFDERYTPAERELILAHEAVHVRRRDPLMNAACALLQCAFWFNPLVHLGARRFRLDQELACDAAVMRTHAGLERSYAQAMFKTQLSAQASLVHCHWRSVHPLKERVMQLSMQLKQTPPQLLRRLAGRLVVGLLATIGAGGALLAHADTAGAPQAGLYRIEMQLGAGGMAASPKLLVRAGEPFAIAKGDGANTWRGDFVLKRVNERDVYLKSVIKHNDRVTGEPAVMVALGQAASIKVKSDQTADELHMQFTVTQAPDKAP